MNNFDVQEFLRERDEALLSLDKEKIIAYCRKYGVQLERFSDNDEVFWRAVHKAICNITTMPEEVRARSEKWLYEHGSSPDV